MSTRKANLTLSADADLRLTIAAHQAGLTRSEMATLVFERSPELSKYVLQVRDRPADASSPAA